jgi:formyl-CoA transferase
MDSHVEGPLSGLKVLDLATFVSASFSATLLGDFGADVVKVELPGQGDAQRGLGRAKVDASPDSTWWSTIARNKRSVTLDLRLSEAKPVFERLVLWADVIVENFRPGTLEAWGIGADWIHSINPNVTLLRVSGYGQTGPFAERAAFERAAQAFSGLMYVTGEPDGPPQRVGLPVCDYTSGLWGAFGILLCLLARERGCTAQGQVVDHAIYASILPMLRDLASLYDLTGEVAGRTGNKSAESAPGEAYKTSDQRWVFIAVTGDRVFAKAMRAIGRPELAADPRFATGVGRLEYRRELDTAMAEWAESRSLPDVLHVMDNAGVPASAVHSIRDLLENEHVQARGDFVHAGSDSEPGVLMPSVLPRLSQTPGSIRRRAPRLGEHTDEVVREAQVPPADLDAARRGGVFGDRITDDTTSKS